MVMMFVMVMGCNSGGVKEGEGESSQSKFLKSIIGLRNEFLNVFTSFGDMVGGILGFNAVKSDDKRSKVGEHFKTIGDGLKNTKDKLDELSKQIVSTSNADIKGVEAVIQVTSEVIAKLITSVTELAGITKEGNVDIGDAGTAGNAAAVAADKASVEAIIKGVKEIVETAEKSGVKIEKGNAGNSVANDSGPKAVVHNARAGAGDATKLAGEVAKADPWAMIDKIKNAKTKTTAPAAGDDAGQLATASAAAANDNGTASTN
ncbi:variable large family protein, partial [Borrelia crocidurae]